MNLRVDVQKPKCPFCGGVRTAPVYMMDAYAVFQCKVCGTGQVSPMPTEDDLKEFYKGFLFAADMRNLGKILKSAPILFSRIGLVQKGPMKMLDVGGGGGFYSKAFEEHGWGESTYVDLDSEACKFASEKVGLNNVLNQDASLLTAREGMYDFILCRHLIEHLADPTQFILKMAAILKEGGTMLLICPNGDSLEYFAYPKTNLKDRIKKITSSSGFSTKKVVSKMLFGAVLHGIDPPRHLWAISRHGMKRFLKSNGFNAVVETFPLTDPACSPYFYPRSFSERISALGGDLLTSRIRGGTHLTATIRKS